LLYADNEGVKRALVLLIAAAPILTGQTKIVRPKEIDEVLVNPGIGFTTLNRFNGDPLNPGTKWTEGHPFEVFPFSGKLEVAGQPLTSIAGSTGNTWSRRWASTTGECSTRHCVPRTNVARR